jgi:hypothetical protein
MLGTSWLVVLGGFMLVSWGASHIAHRAVSLPAQYAALIAMVVAQAIIFVPFLALADNFAPGAIQSAPRGLLRRSLARAVRLGRADVLVRATHLHQLARLTTLRLTA